MRLSATKRENEIDGVSGEEVSFDVSITKYTVEPFNTFCEFKTMYLPFFFFLVHVCNF